ncbi:legumin J-like [Punica granatum]|uniref:Cupin type-1 domain-containing protein n=2 Tax=Punica granatum TaxID=22663 RepID=A0A218XJL8_PUNGR|nr:legumin J-like [Punica granatum]OWM84906.1 hypothetical protein CDL15_Pgr027693 [Punica granatum]PKI74839.1 hypothetical protein CRG98_004611 [Punica granatum]
MEMELLARPPVKAFDGEGGSYSAWSPDESIIIGEANVGAAKFVLHPFGFGLPHYSDSSKVGFVLQGTGGVAGVLLPQSAEERVVKLKKGDMIALPVGTISWWFNDGQDNSDLVIVFLGSTSNSYIPGTFTYFFLAGPQSILGGFSPEVTRRAYNMNKKEVTELTESQPHPLIVKLNAHTGIGDLAKTEAIIGRPLLEDGRSTVELTGSEVPLLEQAGLSVQWVRLDAGALLGPTYTADTSARVMYMVGGSGRVEIVGFNGKRCMAEVVKEGEVVVVPKFFTVAAVAGEDGMECVTVTTSPRHVVKELAGKASPWKAMSPEALEAALNVSSPFLKCFLSKIDDLSF